MRKLKPDNSVARCNLQPGEELTVSNGDEAHPSFLQLVWVEGAWIIRSISPQFLVITPVNACQINVHTSWPSL